MNDRLPLHHCQSTYCTSLASYLKGKILCFGDPGDSIVGWCNLCGKFVCGRCALLLEFPQEDWDALCAEGSEFAAYRNYDTAPLILHCKRCGTVLRKGRIEKMFVLDNPNS